MIGTNIHPIIQREVTVLMITNAIVSDGPYQKATTTCHIGTDLFYHSLSTFVKSMSESPPLVSVVLPTYNRSSTLGRAIDSVLDQTFANFELIIVDDGSTDDTTDVLDAYTDPRIRIIKHKNSKGGSAARNTGISESRGKHIAFIDSDDKWIESKLERQLKQIESCTNISAVYTGYYKNHSGYRELGHIPKHGGNIFEAQLARDRVNPTSTVLVKSECFDAVGKFDESLDARQDYEMWLRISKEFNFGYIKDPLVIMYEGENRITNNIDDRIQSTLDIIDKYSMSINNLSESEKRDALATQYFSLGRYCQKQRDFTKARLFLTKSLKNCPLYIKAWIVLFSCIVRYDMNDENFVKVKNTVRERSPL